MENRIKVVFISDTHSNHRKLEIPECDILIHGGDITHRGEISILKDFLFWFADQDAEYRIFIAGNHDFCFEKKSKDFELTRSLLTDYGYSTNDLGMRDLVYLQDGFVTVEGIKIYGAPWQPWFHDWAFNIRSQEELARKWSFIPYDVDILVTHGPPYLILDECEDGSRVGCKQLIKRIDEVSPKYHLFGHIHEAYGTYSDEYDENGTIFMNGSIAGGSAHGYVAKANDPIVFEI